MQQHSNTVHLAVNASLASTAPGRPVTPSSAAGTVLLEGWALKKRRKRMQGAERNISGTRSVLIIIYTAQASLAGISCYITPVYFPILWNLDTRLETRCN